MPKHIAPPKATLILQIKPEKVLIKRIGGTWTLRVQVATSIGNTWWHIANSTSHAILQSIAEALTVPQIYDCRSHSAQLSPKLVQPPQEPQNK